MAIGSDIAGVVAGLVNGNRGVPTPDLKQLFSTIQNAGVYQKGLINALPAQLKPLYDQYVASTNQAGQTLQSGTSQIGNDLLAKTEANYSPEVAQAAEDAAKTAIYADLPGQQNAIRQALAATGGFDRGAATAALAAPVLQAGSKYAQSVANITSQQLQAKQAATQQAINTVTNMNDQALMTVFGMSREQALQILNGNRQDLKDQLTSLINRITRPIKH